MAGAAMPATAATLATPPGAPRGPSAAMSPQRLREAARDFEAFYLSRALEPMFEGLSSEPPFGGSTGEDMWRSLLIDEYGKAIAKAGGIGIADAIVRELIAVQEGAAAVAPDAPAPAATMTPERKQP
jgi:Rod binding domain-containing protein